MNKSDNSCTSLVAKLKYIVDNPDILHPTQISSIDSEKHWLDFLKKRKFYDSSCSELNDFIINNNITNPNIKFYDDSYKSIGAKNIYKNYDRYSRYLTFYITS